MSRFVARSTLFNQVRHFTKFPTLTKAARLELNQPQHQPITTSQPSLFLKGSKNSMLTSQKLVGDVADEHLAREAAEAVRYTRLVKSGAGEVNLLEH